MLFCLSSVSLCLFSCLFLRADMEKAFGWLAANRGACLDAEYPYTARVGTCNSACRRVLKINGYTAVAANSEAAFVVSGSGLEPQLSAQCWRFAAAVAAGRALQLPQLSAHCTREPIVACCSSAWSSVCRHIQAAAMLYGVATRFRASARSHLAACSFLPVLPRPESADGHRHTRRHHLHDAGA